jgi:hypothetical protein
MKMRSKSIKRLTRIAQINTNLNLLRITQTREKHSGQTHEFNLIKFDTDFTNLHRLICENLCNLCQKEFENKSTLSLLCFLL